MFPLKGLFCLLLIRWDKFVDARLELLSPFSDAIKQQPTAPIAGNSAAIHDVTSSLMNVNLSASVVDGRVVNKKAANSGETAKNGEQVPLAKSERLTRLSTTIRKVELVVPSKAAALKQRGIERVKRGDEQLEPAEENAGGEVKRCEEQPGEQPQQTDGLEVRIVDEGEENVKKQRQQQQAKKPRKKTFSKQGATGTTTTTASKGGAAPPKAATENKKAKSAEAPAMAPSAKKGNAAAAGGTTPTASSTGSPTAQKAGSVGKGGETDGKAEKAKPMEGVPSKPNALVGPPDAAATKEKSAPMPAAQMPQGPPMPPPGSVPPATPPSPPSLPQSPSNPSSSGPQSPPLAPASQPPSNVPQIESARPSGGVSFGKTPNYKLIYFDARGICEPIRLLFHYAKVPFDDVRISRKQWLALKDSTVYGKVPILEVDGKPLTYCHTIARYLARQFDLAGRNSWEQAKVDEISDFHADVAMDLQPYMYVVAGFHQGDKHTLRQAIFLPNVEKHFPIYVNLLKLAGSGFFMPSGITWVDFVIAEYMTTVRHFEPQILDKYPAITKFVRKVQTQPQIFEYITNREHQPV